MKNKILLLYLLFSVSISSQIVIKGTVYQNNEPLENVAVYLNSTMLGTTTNGKGEFSLPVKEGHYELIVSYLGFKKINYTLNTQDYKKPLKFYLEEEESVLGEVIIRKSIYDRAWRKNLKIFEKNFIGESKLAKHCKIVNPKDIYFKYDENKKILQAFARKPIIIENKGLGYSIVYELVYFYRSEEYTSYLGYSKYQELEGNKRKIKYWERKRLEAYNGSPRHFYKSLLENNLMEDGFRVDLFERIPNPKRPSEEEVEKAKEILGENIKIPRNWYIEDKKILTAKDSAMIVLNNNNLPLYEHTTYDFNIERSRIIGFYKNTNYLLFEDNMLVYYIREEKEQAFLETQTFEEKELSIFQPSLVIPIKKPVILNDNGTLKNPLNVMYFGYWSYEKFANSLPLNYDPTFSKQ
ncbi:hypothetical protein LPB03_09020 [Polaribacter vadi]|uniref:Carboxypeptidase-like regulatory domain-containing protein n=1 Tax=Polaribacter vadi TaxID=1774273 RepID=A0A1B8U3T1_9FLAO|nr:carboxypeptidase-like regulatory domain-containing protein [Polaribacter vadi]AOW17597.1 hypothetical protein LPB03_09020 [Polaribacter vadi]OBY66516.1 hypothetical protein LPB3_00515 [Polaribacter vadi]